MSSDESLGFFVFVVLVCIVCLGLLLYASERENKVNECIGSKSYWTENCKEYVYDQHNNTPDGTYVYMCVNKHEMNLCKEL